MGYEEGRSRYVQGCVLAGSCQLEEGLDPAGKAGPPRQAVMVAGPEKEIGGGGVFAKGEVRGKTGARLAGH
jgi:hypothetical protein